MVHLKDGLVCRCPLRALSGLVFQHVIVFLLLTHSGGGQLQTIGPPQPIVVMVGDDVVLPCQLEPPVDAVQMTIEWGRPDLKPRFVYVWHNGQEHLVDQNTAYKGRVALSVNKLKQGDISLRLSKVKVSDSGTYRGFIPVENKEYFVELVVGAVSSPGIALAGLDKSSCGVVLQCESTGWYPEPEVLWLDGEGNLLSAGPTETVRGPDDLYTVSSRVTVEKRHGDRFTCRVQQNKINQTRDTHIQVPDDFFMSSSSCTASTVISVLFGLMLILTVVGFVWKLRQNKTAQRMKKKEDLDEKKAKLDEDFQRTEEEQKEMVQTLGALTELTEELTNQNKKLTAEMQEAEKLADENEKKMKSVEQEVDDKGGDKTVNKAQGYLKLKEHFTDMNPKLNDRKKEQQTLQMNTDKLLQKIFDEVKRITERKKEMEKHMEQIKQQLQETERQREEIQRKLQSMTGDKKPDNKTNQIL